jgi:hypothetical protein
MEKVSIPLPSCLNMNFLSWRTVQIFWGKAKPPSPDLLCLFVIEHTLLSAQQNLSIEISSRYLKINTILVQPIGHFGHLKYVKSVWIYLEFISEYYAYQLYELKCKGINIC